MSDTTPGTPKLSWWRRLSSGLKRTSSSLGHGRCRPRHQAQARPRHARRYRGCAAARRSRHRRGGPDCGRRRRRPLRQGDFGRRSEDGGRDRSREGAGAGGEAAGDRRGAKAVRHPRGRRQRLGQDHHHRQACRETECRGPQDHDGGRRYVSRRGDRAAQGLGRAHQIAGHCGRAGFGFGEPRLQRADRGEGTEYRRAAGRYRRAAAEQGRADERTRKGRSRHQEGRCVGPACGAAGARCHGGTKCAVAGRGISSYRWRHRPRDDEARRHRARRHPGGAGGEIQTAGALHRRRRRHRRSRAVHRAGFCQRDCRNSKV